MFEDIAISVKNVYKDFKLPHQSKESVKSFFTNIFSLGSNKYDTQHALRDISFDIKKGEFFGIVGRNGSGKSTLLKILAGIYQPTKGSTKTVGKVVPFIELGVGFNPELTGRENVFLNGAILGFSQKEVEVNYQTIVDFAELEDFMDQKLKNYSSGMQVRLAFACATMAKADILLIDEVLAVGDADFQRKCFNYFKEIKKEKKTVIFVTHDMSAVREYCDRAILINDSRITFSGSADDVSEEYIKLFTIEGPKSETHHEERWGDGSMVIESPTFKLSKDEIQIEYNIKNNDHTDDALEPVLGMVIEDAAGQSIVGTNSKILRKKIENKNNIKVKWTLQNIFSSGEYTVNLAVHSNNGVDVYDWWNGAVQFSIENKFNTPYTTSPKIDLAY